MHYDLLIRGGTCVTPWGSDTMDVGVRDGRIAALGVPAGATAEAVIDAAGLHVLPGLIDSHVHLRDPGDPAVETIETGTRAAILGGIATLFDMPNTVPPIADAGRVAWKRDYVAGRSWCDIGLYVAGTKTNIDALAALEREAGVCAVKVFAGSSTAALMIEDDAHLERAMRAGHRRMAFHSEDEYRLQARKALFSRGQPYRTHMAWRDPECAFLGTRRLMALARRTGRATHILHVSTAEELAYLRDFRDVATVEVLVNHLTQVAPECYDTLGGLGVMNPPIRDARHRAAAWAAVRDGTVDTVGSDHAPHARAAKAQPWPDCPAGLTGVQTLVPVMLDHVAAGRLSLARLVDLMAAGPARVYGLLGKGRIAAGYDADFTLVDLKAHRRIEESWIASPCGWTPFAGLEVTGWPVATIVRGTPVMRDDAVLGEPVGRLARFAA
ncbi:dihydroorotase [Methylobacterium sp. PvP062]|uniref:Dihydroorotase n=1 Tax=Methylobacterium radiotolerans TaxID=31998 RepID=A0ABV2NS69_9HYPH|nr:MULTISPECIES: dihydroorotase [unclassified Methylobacterium]MBP2498588.1 dihydroorotase [Methylobacterium sp. PvP105]MBP2506126.1 dihydroorotase [Methylobacterium sp. PvP109]MCX7335468.1 dihydroorotase [Hyphomicrobiales bacterium]RUP22710.1 MAG: dihydroorotase [Methylobacterium sp.]